MYTNLKMVSVHFAPMDHATARPLFLNRNGLHSGDDPWVLSIRQLDQVTKSSIFPAGDLRSKTTVQVLTLEAHDNGMIIQLREQRMTKGASLGGLVVFKTVV